MSEPRTVPCPHCEILFIGTNDVWQHIKRRHGQKLASAYRPKTHPKMREREPSLGEELADALMDVACGGEAPEHIALMFPDEIAAARKGGRP